MQSNMIVHRIYALDDHQFLIFLKSGESCKYYYFFLFFFHMEFHFYTGRKSFITTNQPSTTQDE